MTIIDDAEHLRLATMATRLNDMDGLKLATMLAEEWGADRTLQHVSDLRQSAERLRYLAYCCGLAALLFSATGSEAGTKAA